MALAYSSGTSHPAVEGLTDSRQEESKMLAVGTRKVSSYTKRGVCYTFKGQSLENGVSCIFQEEHSFMKDAEPA